MAGINDYSNTAGSNTTINGIDIAEGCSPAGINNAIRQLMADIADMDDGVVPLQTPDINGGTIDGAVIGGTTPAAGTFTNLTATGTLTGLLGNVVEDVTPQLGGDLDLNSNDITGTGNINITGTATVSGDLTVDTNTLYVDSANNSVGIGTSSPANPLVILKTQNAETISVVNNQDSGSSAGSSLRLAALGGYWDLGIGSTAKNSNALTFGISGSERMRITSSGNVGIGTSSPDVALMVDGQIKAVDSTVDLRMNPIAAANVGIVGTYSNHGLVFHTNALEKMRIDSSGNVGIGTSSPDEILHISGADGTLRIQNSTTTSNGDAVGKIEFESYNNNVNAMINNEQSGGTSGGELVFSTRPFAGTLAERMRIDGSGNLLVGMLSPSNLTTGFSARANSLNSFCRDTATADAAVLALNKKTGNGDILLIQKDGTTSGKIGAVNTELYIGSNSGSGSYLNFGNNRIIPATSSGGNRDNVIDLGNAASRFDDIFATNGTIQTSDQNEKQSIQSLTVSEMAVAQRISKLFKTFKWNSAVEEKGDSARTHTGIIAQDVQQAFSDEGLDASNYALFISSTWWEKEISVDAVAPQEAVYETQTDEEGNEIQVLVQEAVEGKDAYTYMDTKEEATEGYTEKTRLGIRYPELLSFVSSAFEQRLTNIETRLTALET